MANGIGVGLETVARTGLHGNRLNERDLTKIIAILRFGKMHLDRPHLHGLDRIVNRDRGVGVGRRVDDKRVELSAALLDPVDDHALVVRLPHLDLGAAVLRGLADESHELVIGLASVDVRLANPQQVQVRPVDNQNLQNPNLRL